MALGTFGAIVYFAIDLEKRAAEFYESAARGNLAATFGELARDSRKRQDRLERARQELVAEMILESITGLDDEDYNVTLDPGADEADLLAQARNLERTAARFYEDAAGKMPIREVVRLFERMLRENEKRQAKLA